MAEILDYARPASTLPSRLLSISTIVTLLYPLWVVIMLYGEWLVAWAVLGHPPRPSLDDPKDIWISNWLHNFTSLVLAGMVPAAVAAIVLNMIQAIARRAVGRGLLRLVAMVLLWTAVFVLLRCDPGRVVDWWFD